MPYNLPSYDTNSIDFGPCTVYAGPAGFSGATPTTGIGSVRGGASLEITREILEVTQGNPAMVVKRFVNVENVSFSVTAIEWNFDNFARAISGGSTTSNTFAMGGQVSLDDLALKIVHESPSGNTYELYLWKANGAGTLTIPFSDEVHEFEYNWNTAIPYNSANNQAEDWNGTALSKGEQLFKIKKIT